LSTMFCCFPVPPFEEDKPLIIDIKKIFSDRAWSSFSSTFSFCQRKFLDRKKFIIEVPENYFSFETISQSQKSNMKITGKKKAKTADGGDVGEAPKKKGSRKEKSAENLSLNTVFKNSTAESQTYRFRFEKTRRTEVSVTFQKGFTIGGKANFSIGIPYGSDSKAELAIETSYQVSKSEGQTFEETILMEATSDITVGPNSCYTANVELDEKSLYAEFKVVTRMTIPQGKAPIYIKKKSDGEQVYVYNIKNLHDEFENFESVQTKDLKETEIDFVTEGIIKGVIACNHKIVLTSDESDDMKKQAQINRHLYEDERRIERR
ncbi:uncharacterized protein LOC131931929, partial [Physella acuta]|uniref:uncharacterized protein LOC131931929 n=1 Tax=Physella acuta TaxID=109671 RepID=UPI0027DCE9B0